MSSSIRNVQKSFPLVLPLLLSAVILLLWLIPPMVKKFQGNGSSTVIQGFFPHAGLLFTILEIIALLATIIAPLVYGWYTKDTTGAVIIGIVPFLLTMLVARIGSDFTYDNYLIRAVLYTGSLCFIGGLVGFFAARHETKWMMVAGALAGFWIVLFLSGIS